MKALRDEINKLKEMKKANQTNTQGYTRYADAIEEKIKYNKEDTILRDFNQVEKQVEEWVTIQQKDIFKPSFKHKADNSAFFNFKKCEKAEKPLKDNKAKPYVASEEKKIEVDINLDNNNSENKEISKLFGDLRI